MRKRILGLGGSVRMYTKEGSILMEVSKLGLDESDLTIIRKGHGYHVRHRLYTPRRAMGNAGTGASEACSLSSFPSLKRLVKAEKDETWKERIG